MNQSEELKPFVGAPEEPMTKQEEKPPLMIFDWDKAARMIIEHKTTYAGVVVDSKGIVEAIYSNGPIDASFNYHFLKSGYWKPKLAVNGGSYECWRYWDGKSKIETKWPEQALVLLARVSNPVTGDNDGSTK